MPHSGAMCLLDAVLRWDTSAIVCHAFAPHGDHPLARDGVVPAVAAIEYAAQATAVHGALLDTHRMPRPGMLAKLSEVEMHGDVISMEGGSLIVRAQLVSRGAAACLYDFEVDQAEQRIAGGRLMVVLE